MAAGLQYALQLNSIQFVRCEHSHWNTRVQNLSSTWVQFVCCEYGLTPLPAVNQTSQQRVTNLDVDGQHHLLALAVMTCHAVHSLWYKLQHQVQIDLVLLYTMQATAISAMHYHHQHTITLSSKPIQTGLWMLMSLSIHLHGLHLNAHYGQTWHLSTQLRSGERTDHWLLWSTIVLLLPTPLSDSQVSISLVIHGLTNHFRTGQGPCHINLHKWGLTQSPSCDCGRRQTMTCIADACPLRKSEGGLNLLHEACGWNLQQLQHSRNNNSNQHTGLWNSFLRHVNNCVTRNSYKSVEVYVYRS